MTNKQTAKEKIESLVIRFEEQFESYKNSDYNETLTRRDFIDPFFKALGWDIDNESGYAEAYREVIHEDRVKVSGSIKAPDYSFRLVGGKRLFFVEAKKPSISVKEDIQPAYQVRRYGWSAKLPISIITDFEEFSIYDCTKKPKPNDKPPVARIKYLSFRDYIKEFDFLWDTFSKEQVLKGSFDKFLQSDTHKKGTATVDKDFLESLDRWRTYLAISISWNNKTLDEEEINFVVQQTIDRIIFLRIAEDRGVEPYGTLLHSTKLGNLYQNLFELFQKADQKYNSGLFDFKKDKISQDVIIDNKVIKTIINELYYPECPYEFSVLSVEILGSAYEQFLGKVIRITPAHHAKIEEKPEVRKAGGVYYTPQYIVDYIVKNTVGILIEGKTPKEISKIKILDPACGSGSFLIGAFQYLLDFHKDYYSENGKPSKGKKDNPLTPDGHLTTAEKKRILLNNIFGVDLDANAVEVTKLSLLLKCLEGETEASIKQQLSIWNERVLPTLDNNIKDGNSLIDTDFYSSELDLGFEKRIKPFNWLTSFPDIVEQGGFDIVLGNPPYVRQELFLNQKEYLKSRYKVFHGMADLYAYFIEKGISLLNQDGIFGIIVANKWMKARYGLPLREWLQKQNIVSIIDFGDLPVFENATTYPCILVCSRKPIFEGTFVTTIKTLKFNSLENYVLTNQINLDQKKLGIEEWNISSSKDQELLEKLKSIGIPLGKYVNGKIYRGILTGLNEAFVIDSETKDRILKQDINAAEIIKPYLAGRDIKRYNRPQSDKYLIFTRRGTNIDDYPSIKSHLENYKKSLMPRPKDYSGPKWEGRKPGSYKWYEIQDSIEYFTEFERPKIMYQVFQVSPCFIWDTKSFYCNNSIWIIPKNDKLLLAILNSPLGWYLISKFCTKIQNGYQLIYKYLEKFPIKSCDLNNFKEKTIHDEVIKMVDFRLELENQLHGAKLETKINQIKAKIDYCEKQINYNIYKLYNLSEDDIKTIEGK
jgi:hypothetical protein